MVRSASYDNIPIEVGDKCVNLKEDKTYVVAKIIHGSDWPIELDTGWILSEDYFRKHFVKIAPAKPAGSRCGHCRGSGIVPGSAGEYTIDECSGCKGTGIEPPKLKEGAKVRVRGGHMYAGYVGRVTYINEHPFRVELTAPNNRHCSGSFYFSAAELEAIE